MEAKTPKTAPPDSSGIEPPGPDWLVAVGASAGGLEAMRPLLRGLRASGRVAYLIAQHRSPSAVEALTEILARDCQLPVALIAGGEEPRPDRVYVAPPGHHLEVRDGRLTLSEPTAGGGVVPSIDTLFASVAEGYGDRAVGVLLSGTGHDGTRGAQAIRGAGGRVLVQLPTSAGQDAMVESALAAGIVDEALRPEALAARLSALGEGPRAPRGPAVGGIDDGTLREVLGLVRDATHTDFGHYREPTLRRQTLRRMAALGLTEVQDYLRLLRSDPQEAQRLRQGFMISVSAFFRDPEVFAALGKALDGLIAGRQPGEPIRAWVPGCATGEEAYSIAALIAERLDPDGAEGPSGGAAQVFATDLDAEAIRIARAGVYPKAALDGLDPHLCERFFTTGRDTGRDTVRVVKALRELCVFAEHDLLRHPSFPRMDLVSCRNVLIYFDAQVQQEVLARFHYALTPGGLLLLGKSECSESVQRLFEPLDGASRIYRRRDVPTPMLSQTRWETMPPPSSGSWPPDQPARDPERVIRDLLLERYAPASVLVDERLRPLHLHGPVQRYLTLPKGRADFSLVGLCAAALRNEVRSAAHLVLHQAQSEVRGHVVPMEIDGETVRVQVVARRAGPGPRPSEAALVLSFEESPAPGAESQSAGEAGAATTGDQLQELRATRGHLHAIIGDMESSNAELQSLNEELQVTSEELQASNEELSTLNDELRSKSGELATVNDILSSIQDSIQLGLMVVDRQYRIRRFNPLAGRIFGLMPKDLGRSLAGVPCTLPLPDLRPKVEAVIAGGPPLVERVGDQDRQYLMQVVPHLDPTGNCIGALVTFADISELTTAEALRHEAEERFRLFMDHSLAVSWIKDAEGRMVWVSRTFENAFGVRLADCEGKTDAELWPAELAGEYRASDQAALAAGAPIEMEEETRAPDGSRRFWHGFKIPFTDAAGRRFVGGNVVDVTASRQASADLAAERLRLRTLVDTIPDLIWLKDPDGVYLLCNPAFERFFGSPERDIVGRRDDDFVPREVADAFRDHDRKAMAAGGPSVNQEWLDFAADGHRALHLTTKTPLLDPAGQVEGVLGIARDITALEQAREALERSRDDLERQVAERTAELQASEARLRLILESSADGLIGIDAEGRVTFANPAAEAMLGWPAGGLLGRDLHATVRHCQADGTPETPADCPILATLRDGQTRRTDQDLFSRADGTRFPVSYAVRPMLEDAAVVGAVLAFTDASLRRATELALERAKSEAEHLARIKGEFLANMSHEIRTPLNGVLGLAQIGYRHSEGQPRLREDFAGILESGKVLLGVIDDILDFSKIEAGKLRIDQVPIAPSRILGQVVEAMRARAQQDGTVLETTPGLGDPGHCLGDPVRLAQILFNLVSNAVKFSPGGRVGVGVEREGDRLVFRIADTGIGMSAGQVARLFTPFEQADSGTTRKFGGTGLGLAITRRLVELMGGEIHVVSAPGKGSTFEVRLPYIETTGEVAQIGATLPPRVAVGPRLAGLRLLVAEDNEINRLVIEDMLTAEGARVTLVGNGRLAVEAVTADPDAWDAVLMDVQMPEMDGLEATRQIHALAPGLSIIGQTAHALEEERAECLAAGMVGQVSKPISQEDLVAVILGRSRRDPTLPPVPPAAAPVIDWAGLAARYSRRPAFVDRLAQVMLDNTAEVPGQLRQWAAEGNLVEIGKTAHSLKGAVGNLLAKEVEDLALRTQLAARAADPRATALTLELANALDRLLEACAERLGQGPAAQTER